MWQLSRDRCLMSKKERRAYLRKELKEYLRETPMTEDERTALREWVAEGNSVHENGAFACYEGGVPCDYLDVYRYEEEIRRDLEKLSPREQRIYIDRLNGVETIDTLREDVKELRLKAEAYYKVIFYHNLENEALQMIQWVKEEQEELARQSAGFMASLLDDEELPFSD